MPKNKKRKSKALCKSFNGINPNILENILLELAQDLDKKLISEKYKIGINTIFKIYSKNREQINDIKKSLPSKKTDNTINSACDINDKIVFTYPDDIKFNANELLMKISEISSINESSLNMERDCIPVLSEVIFGMIRHRHPMPTNNYIFDTMSSDLMFDYDKQYEVTKRNILKCVNIVDGVAQNFITLYVTGLSCVLSTIIRVCNDLKINLTLMHHNKSTNKYQSQIVFNSFTPQNVCPKELNNIARRKLCTCGCTADEFVSNNGGYEIIKVYIDSSDTSKTLEQSTYRDIILFTDKLNAWKYYIESVETNKNASYVYFNTVIIENGKCVRDATISRNKHK